MGVAADGSGVRGWNRWPAVGRQCNVKEGDGRRITE